MEQVRIVAGLLCEGSRASLVVVAGGGGTG